MIVGFAAQESAEKWIYEYAQIDGEPLAVRASIGLSLFPRDAQDARTLMASADAAMYRIKQGHKRRL